MTLRKEIINQISGITEKLIRSSFSIQENFVASSETDIYWSGFKNISFTLKEMPYDTIYQQCVLEKAFNFMLIDNALIQLLYQVKDNQVIKHRLAYFPHPNFLNYQDNPEKYEELFYGNKLFTDIIERKVITIPLRFDFDISETNHVEFSHPKSHLTLGNFQNCRIPVARPLTPNKFILFILRSFYFERFCEYFRNEDFGCDLSFEVSISKKEKELIYIQT